MPILAKKGDFLVFISQNGVFGLNSIGSAFYSDYYINATSIYKLNTAQNMNFLINFVTDIQFYKSFNNIIYSYKNTGFYTIKFNLNYLFTKIIQINITNGKLLNYCIQ